MTITLASDVTWDLETDIVVVGAGGCGMTAALAAAQRGAQVLLLEKDRRIGGNTALSTGMVPAAWTRAQQQAGIDDSPQLMAQDILAKNCGGSDRDLTFHLCSQSAALVEWLSDHAGITLELVTDFKYSGHSRHRMHAPPERTGAALAEQLWRAVSRQELIQPVVNATVLGLVVDEQRAVAGVVVQRAGVEYARCGKVILASSGFGGNRQMVARYCPEILDGIHFGHAGNTGEAIEWAMALGAATENMDAYQGHGSVAHPHGTLVTWAVIIHGGFLVNSEGHRFGDESEGYSSYAVKVLRQAGGLAYEIFDKRIHQAVLSFTNFRMCVEAGAVRSAETIEELAGSFDLDPRSLARTLDRYNRAAVSGGDEFGRTEFGEPLRPPYYGVQVSGALFHTQGGLKIDKRARVLRADGTAIANLYAGGGAAVGISGSGAAGYLAGNGLLTALGLGKIAGEDV